MCDWRGTESDERRVSYAGKIKIKLFFNKLGVPVGNVDRVQERHPFPVAGHAEGLLHKGGPLRLQWSADEGHAGLLWCPAALAPIAFVTRADDIFPDRGAPLRTGNDMIQVEFVPGQ